MSDGNGNGGLTVEEGREWYEAMAAAQTADPDAAAAFLIGGGDPYPDADWWAGLDAKFAECPDAQKGAVISARLVQAEYTKRGKLKPETLSYRYVRGEKNMERLREANGFERMAEWNWSPDPFAYGSEQAVPGVGGPLQSYVPIWPGPLTRQLYWQDYFAMSAKAFEAYNHDPISWRCVHMKQEFALGKGLQATVTYSSSNQGKAGQRHDKAAEVWEEFWKRNRMDQRMDMMARDISIMGEQFLRYFVKNKTVTIRSLDPASIYDLITDPEDHETVFAYHQQFQTPYQLWSPQAATPPTGVQAPEGATTPGTSAKFIIRQILPQEIDHYRLNTGAYERRGRSDLFPALGWIRRLRDYLTSHVIRADMLSRICWDLQVQGNAGTIAAVRALLFPNGQPPQPGTVFAHNVATKLEPMAPTGSAGGGSRWDPVMDALVTMVANSIGLPKDWLGFGMTTTRASALVATEPAARSLEELQGTVEMILHDCFDRVMAAAKIPDAEIEFTFPSIATEDRSQKLKDLAFAESMGWLAKATSGSIAAKELGITGYDAEEEAQLIADEFEDAEEAEDDKDGVPDPLTGKKPQKPLQGDGKIRRPMIAADHRQAPKLDPTKAVVGQEDEPPGLLVPFSGPVAPGTGAGNGGPPGTGASKPPAAPGANGAPTRAGMPANENAMSAGGAKNLKQDLKESEPVFTASQVRLILAAAMRERRRRPDDPVFQQIEQRYRQASAENLETLAHSVASPGGSEEHVRNE